MERHQRDNECFSVVIDPKHLRIGFAILALGVVASFGSCQSQSPVLPPPPLKLVPESTMVRILVDVHLLESARAGNVVLGDSIPLKTHAKALFARHGVTDSAVRVSLRYYVQDADRGKALYSKVLEKLQSYK